MCLHRGRVAPLKGKQERDVKQQEEEPIVRFSQSYEEADGVATDLEPHEDDYVGLERWEVWILSWLIAQGTPWRGLVCDHACVAQIQV